MLLAVVAWQVHLLRGMTRERHDATGHLAGSPLARSSSSAALQNPAAQSFGGEGMPKDGSQDSEASELIPDPATTNRPQFDWQSVESSDYRTYIQNLRAIGCPEQTIRDIVKADVTQAMAARRAAITSQHLADFEYWRADTPEAVAARQSLERDRRQLDEDLGSILKDLLGPDTLPPSTAAEWRETTLEQQLNFLPDSLREQTVSVLMEYADVDLQIKALSTNPRTPENQDERRRIIELYDREREALHALLTPEQYELADMTVSWTADNLRRAMAKFQPTEEEFRLIFREWRAQDENLAVIFANGGPDPGNQHVFEHIASLLTPERYALYRESWWK